MATVTEIANALLNWTVTVGTADFPDLDFTLFVNNNTLEKYSIPNSKLVALGEEEWSRLLPLLNSAPSTPGLGEGTWPSTWPSHTALRRRAVQDLERRRQTVRGMELRRQTIEDALGLGGLG